MAGPRLDPLLDLLADSLAAGRPPLVLTRRRAAEVLGTAPPDAWWAAHAADWRAAGFAAALDIDRGWVTFTPVHADTRPEPLDLRVVVRWVDAADGPGLVRDATGDVTAVADVRGAAGAVATTVWVSTRGEVGLADPAALALALAVARFERLAEAPGFEPGMGEYPKPH